jgi:hypothetical protein
MTELVACLLTGKGTWAEVAKLIKIGDWEKIFLITNSFGKDTFKPNEETRILVIDDHKPLQILVKDIMDGLKDNLVGPEIAVNIISGSGKEHMALIAALLKSGFGVRLVHLTDSGVAEV